MNSHFAGSEVSTNAIRAELISRAERGDKLASELLRSIAKKKEENAGELVLSYRLKAGPATLETAMAGLGLVSIGLVLGIIALISNGFVSADLETLLILLCSFATGQWGLITYSKMSTARLYAQELQKLANIVTVSSLVRQQYADVARKMAKKQDAQRALTLAYGSVA